MDRMVHANISPYLEKGQRVRDDVVAPDSHVAAIDISVLVRWTNSARYSNESSASGQTWLAYPRLADDYGTILRSK